MSSSDQPAPPPPPPADGWAPPGAAGTPGAPEGTKRRRWLLPTIVGVVALFVGVGIGSSGSSAADAEAAPTSGAATSEEVDALKEALEKAESRVDELESAADEALAAADTEPVEEVVTEEVVAEEPAADEPVVEDEAPGLSLAQQNAVGSATSYLNYSSFSRSGLIGQLEFEGFSTEDATFAVDHVAPDWNEQAAGSAQSYLDYSAFSRQGLIDQLVFEGFSTAEAEYGVAAVGY